MALPASVLNLLSPLPDASSTEVFDELVSGRSCRIERIVSRGQTSTEWYDQDEHEWVVVLQGRGKLLIEDREEVDLGVGDALFLPAHTRHKVSWTDPDQDTVWLAVFFSPDTSP